MDTMIQLTDQPIDPQRLVAMIASRDAGAVLLFLGTARETTRGRKSASLEYEAYGRMAEAKMAELRAEAMRRWPLTGCALVHRLGHLAPGEISVAIAVGTPHRQEAFEAGKWLIDTLKQDVPIWKKENWADGTSEWVHPGLDATSTRTQEERA
jgi:molybdopterin synthase catalytic subunit